MAMLMAAGLPELPFTPAVLLQLILKGSGLMKNVNRTFWLMAGALLCLAPAAFAGPPTPARRVPDGSSALLSVLGAGITCIGAMLVRFRRRY